MFENLPLIYNGFGLVLEIVGLVLLLNPIKIIAVRHLDFQSKQSVAFKTKYEETMPVGSGSRIYNAGIFIIIMGLVFQFIAML